MSLINAAARLLRAGDQLSETNQKLRVAAGLWINALAVQTNHCEIPKDVGWALQRNHLGHLYIQFAYEGQEYEVYATWDDQPMNQVHKLCEALAGAQGEKLIQWLESRASQNERFLEGFYAFQKATKTNSSLYDPTNPLDRKILEGMSHCMKPDPHDTID